MTLVDIPARTIADQPSWVSDDVHSVLRDESRLHRLSDACECEPVVYYSESTGSRLIIHRSIGAKGSTLISPRHDGGPQS